MHSQSLNQVYLSLGSNIDRERNIGSALDCLEHAFGEISVSRVYESEAVGFKGEAFFNLVVGIRCQLDLESLSKTLKRIEDQHGRDRSGAKFGSRTLDIDIVCFNRLVGFHQGIELPRPELYYNAFVLLPMADLIPAEIDPIYGEDYRTLAEKLETKQVLWPIDFLWKNRRISYSE